MTIIVTKAMSINKGCNFDLELIWLWPGIMSFGQNQNSWLDAFIYWHRL